MPRFVLLRHEMPHGVHFDFMLETAGVLKTWTLPEMPQKDVEFACTALPDHRIAYLDYEGPVSGDRGTVHREDRGEYSLEQQDETTWIIRATGEKIAGKVVLRHSTDETDQWLFLLE
jgi:hypothetical protein